MAVDEKRTTWARLLCHSDRILSLAVDILAGNNGWEIQAEGKLFRQLYIVLSDLIYKSNQPVNLLSSPRRYRDKRCTIAN